MPPQKTHRPLSLSFTKSFRGSFIDSLLRRVIFRVRPCDALEFVRSIFLREAHAVKAHFAASRFSLPWIVKIRLTSFVEKRRVSAANRICRYKDRRSMPGAGRRARSSLDGDRRIGSFRWNCRRGTARRPPHGQHHDVRTVSWWAWRPPSRLPWFYRR